MYGMLIHICMRLCSLVDIIQTDNNAYVVTPRARMLLCRAERCKQAVLHDKQTVKHLKQMARRYLIEEVNASNGNTGMRCANLLCNPCPFHSMLGFDGAGSKIRCNIYHEFAKPAWWPVSLGSWDKASMNSANKQQLKDIIVLMLELRKKRLVSSAPDHISFACMAVPHPISTAGQSTEIKA